MSSLDFSTFTYQTRVPLTEGQSELLARYAGLYGKAERSLFGAMQAEKDVRKAGGKSLKAEFMERFGLTARQFNAVSAGLKGKIASIKKRRAGLIAEGKARISKLRSRIKKLEKKAPGSFKLHQKKRKLGKLEARLAGLQEDHAAGVVRLCFGSRKLFRAQFQLEANGFDSYEDWLASWKESRNRQFFVLGSKDESAGCQGCVATLQEDGTLSLRLRLPNALEEKYVVLRGLRFPYGQAQIEASIRAGRAVHYRFLRDRKGWRVFVSTKVQAGGRVSHRLAGALGVDVNGDHLAVSQTDRFGNLVRTKRIECDIRGLSTEQARALIGDACTQTTQWAAEETIPVVLEKLDFQKKKAEMEKTAPESARRLSSFAYSSVGDMLRAACFRAGVETIEVNSAYTSVIGAINHAQRFGISVHQGAAVTIARRGLCFREQPAVRHKAIVPVRNGGHVTFSLPARNREKHVWSFWSGISRKRKAAHAAHVRSGDHKKAPGPLERVPAGVPSPLGSIWTLPAQFRHANRQQHCSADVVDDIPI